MGCRELCGGVVPLFTGSYIHMNGQDTGHHSSPKFLSHLAPSATPWYTILAGRLNDVRGVVSVNTLLHDGHLPKITVKAECITAPTTTYSGSMKLSTCQLELF